RRPKGARTASALARAAGRSSMRSRAGASAGAPAGPASLPLSGSAECVRSFWAGSKEIGCLSGQRLVCRLLQLLDFGVTALGHLVILHVLPDRLDLRQLRRVAGQVAERNTRPLQLRKRVAHCRTLMHGVVVHPDHQLPLSATVRRIDLRSPGDLPDEAQIALAVDGTHLLHAQTMRSCLLLQAYSPLLRPTFRQAPIRSECAPP